jgi:hypothetical protein
MQGILREKLLAQALKLADISSAYRTESHRFVALFYAWLEGAEKDLSGLRSPISLLIQSEKSTLTAVTDGYLPSHIQAGSSIRKIQKAAAALSLEKISTQIYNQITSIDHNFEQLSEKLCHAIAVLASKDPEFYKQLSPDHIGINLIWEKLGTTPETIPIYNYFCAKLTPSDRDYLLLDIIQKISVNHTA